MIAMQISGRAMHRRKNSADVIFRFIGASPYWSVACATILAKHNYEFFRIDHSRPSKT